MHTGAGRRDTEITFQNRTVSATSPKSGQKTYDWANLDDNPVEWAEVLDILPSRSENLAEGINLAKRPCRIRIEYRTDITSDMRIQFEGRTVRIVAGPVERGRRQDLEMVCEDWSTEGEET